MQATLRAGSDQAGMMPRAPLAGVAACNRLGPGMHVTAVGWHETVTDGNVSSMQLRRLGLSWNEAAMAASGSTPWPAPRMGLAPG